MNWTSLDTCGYASCGFVGDTVTLSSFTGFFARGLKDQWMSGYYSGGYNLTVHQDSTFLPVTDRNQVHPVQAHLKQNFPNPFNPSTTILFRLDETSFATLRVYDILGRLVETLHEGLLHPGEYITTWSAGNRPSGIYFCRLKAGTVAQTIRLVLLR